jgi:hypothetical protein
MVGGVAEISVGRSLSGPGGFSVCALSIRGRSAMGRSSGTAGADGGATLSESTLS